MTHGFDLIWIFHQKARKKAEVTFLSKAYSFWVLFPLDTVFGDWVDFLLTKHTLFGSKQYRKYRCKQPTTNLIGVKKAAVAPLM